jgi:class 3 adenylate cyclase
MFLQLCRRSFRMVEVIAVSLVGLAAIAAAVWASTRRWRRMHRHPSPTFVVADLAGYTALTEEQGDEAAARVAREFRRTMCALSRTRGATQVKSMGDGVMIWAPDPAGAVALAARVVEQVGRREDLPNEALVSASTQAAVGSATSRTLDNRREMVLRGVGHSVAAWRVA